MVEVKACQRLYLAKGDNIDVHVDASLPQHQIDGIRFLYRQFTKKKLGAVLNDPSGYGKRVQTVLFVGAMRQSLDKPVLVLCREGSQDKWAETFRKWTKLGNAVSIHRSNPPVLKSWVHINPMSQVASFSRREWSLVVVDDSTCRDVIKASIQGRFKLWITNVDLKKNLQGFSTFYKWLYPKEKFNIEDFHATTQTPSLMLSKSIILDAFMEDIVIRRKVDLPHEYTEEAKTTPRATRKNKDATGTKIKRSKRRIIDDSPTNDIPVKIAKDNDFLINSDNNKNDVDKHTDNDIIQNDLFNYINNKSNEIPDNEIIQNKNCNNITKSNEVSKNTENGINNDENNENSIESDKINKSMNSSEPECNNTRESYDLLNDSVVSSQDIVIRYDSDTTVESMDDSSEKLNIEECTDAQKSQDLFSNVDEIHENKIPDINSNTTEIGVNDNGNANCDEIVVNDQNSDIGSKNDLSVSETETGPELTCVERKMKELEELTMKKFKGSLLDSIF